MSVFLRATGAVLAGLAAILTFSLLASPAAADAAASAAPAPTPRIYIPDLPKLGKEQQNGLFKTRKGVFRVRMVGYQLNRWTHFSPSDGECVGTAKGHGFERVVFRQPARRMKLSAFGMRRLTSMILPRLKVRGQLTRKGTHKYTPLENPDPGCPYGDGGGPGYEPPAPDCGTRKFRGIPMSLVALDGFFRLRSEASYKQRPRFRNCPPPQIQWPAIITERTNGKPIQTRFPPRLVFNRKFDRKTGKWSKVILLARGVKKQRSFTGSSVTRLEWTLVLKRLR